MCARTLRFVVIRRVFIEAERHTSENIQKWTGKALEGVAVGLKASELLEPGSTLVAPPTYSCTFHGPPF